MKHLNPELEKLEARIAPCLPPLICVGLCGGGGGGESGPSYSNGSGSSASGSKSSKSKSRESCSS